MVDEQYLVVVSGPSGAGKSTVVKMLCQNHADVQVAVSVTTRAPRRGEEANVAYHFIRMQEFMQHIEDGELLEYANYVGNYYGTLHSEVENRIRQGITCVLEIEVEGAQAVKAQYPGCITVFVQPPSTGELVRRLRARGTDTEEVIEKRLQRAQEELQMAQGYDYQVVNEDAAACAEEIYAIIRHKQAPAKQQ